MGRPRKLTAEQENEVFRRLAEGEKRSVLAKEFGVSYQVIYAVTQREKEAKQDEVIAAACEAK